jgi:predicted DCC family thiol-disulfide oxidoreductase YuxK
MNPRASIRMIYDGHCRLCACMQKVLVKARLVSQQECADYHTLNQEDFRNLNPSRFRNGMALMDLRGAEVLYGEEAVAWIVSRRFKISGLLWRFRFPLWLLGFLYRMVAYNRYIIAPPSSSFACDCFPESSLRYRLIYIIFSVILSLVLTAVFGIALGHYVGFTPGAAAGQMLLIAGTGWVLQILTAAFFLKARLPEYVAHLGTIMTAGLLVLVPSILLELSGVHIWVVPLVSVLCSSLWMTVLHIRRARILSLSGIWTGVWFLYLQATALLWVYYFYFNN